MSAICTAFTKTYPVIDLDSKKLDEKGYDYMILLTYLLETDKGFKVKRINKTTKKGTTVAYELIKDAEDLKQYRDLIQVKIDEFNSKYKMDLKMKGEIDNE